MQAYISQNIKITFDIFKKLSTHFKLAYIRETTHQRDNEVDK